MCRDLETMVLVPLCHVLIKLDVWKTREQLVDDGKALSTFQQHTWVSLTRSIKVSRSPSTLWWAWTIPSSGKTGPLDWTSPPRWSHHLAHASWAEVVVVVFNIFPREKSCWWGLNPQSEEMPSFFVPWTIWKIEAEPQLLIWQVPFLLKSLTGLNFSAYLLPPAETWQQASCAFWVSKLTGHFRRLHFLVLELRTRVCGSPEVRSYSNTLTFWPCCIFCNVSLSSLELSEFLEQPGAEDTRVPGIF